MRTCISGINPVILKQNLLIVPAGFCLLCKSWIRSFLCPSTPLLDAHHQRRMTTHPCPQGCCYIDRNIHTLSSLVIEAQTLFFFFCTFKLPHPLCHKGLHLHIGRCHQSSGYSVEVDRFFPLINMKRKNIHLFFLCYSTPA